MEHSSIDFSQFIFNNQGLFDDLPKAQYQKLFQNQQELIVKSGDLIFEEHQEPQFIYKIVKGTVKKHVKSIFEKEHIFYICTEGDFIGFHAVITDNNYLDSATAMSDCIIQAIPKNDFLEALSQSKLLSDKLLLHLSREFGVFINFTKLLAKYTLRERTALRLLVLHKKFNKEGSDNDIIINRADLSSLIGASLEAVVRTLKDFKEEQLITSHRSSIKILNEAGLIKVTNILVKY